VTVQAAALVAGGKIRQAMGGFEVKYLEKFP